MTELVERYEFGERMVMSQGVIDGADVDGILLDNIPGAKAVEKATVEQDRSGTDYWVLHARGDPLSIDVKARNTDFALRGQDDLALEIWSVVDAVDASGRPLDRHGKVGWTRDVTKRTDYVLWLWRDTGRFCLVPFMMLCRVFLDKWREWSGHYKSPRQFTPTAGGGGWYSQCVFVPRREVWAAIYRAFGDGLVTR